MVRLYISALEYLQNQRIHPAFQDWVRTTDPADFPNVIWTDGPDGSAQLVGAMRIKSSNLKTSEIYAFPLQGSSKFDAKRIAEVRLHHESHLIRKSEDKLQLRWDGDKKWTDVKGELFRPVGSSSYFPDTYGDPGVYLLTEAFTRGDNQAQWTVTNDKSIQITVQKGKKELCRIETTPDIQGFTIASAPVNLEDDPNASAPTEYREKFFSLALLSVIIMPVQRSASATKAIWWAKKLGGIFIEEGQGAF